MRPSMRAPRVSVKHLNPRQGITTAALPPFFHTYRLFWCETPKSPPGDYKRRVVRSVSGSSVSTSVKHLNPRQGITKNVQRRVPSRRGRDLGVKHLNPRQGITTRCVVTATRCCHNTRVKHLNPRQGITTSLRGRRECESRYLLRCETPKSPPGDYNSAIFDRSLATSLRRCETPKSPPGDYNIYQAVSSIHLLRHSCETPKSPPGDYNATLRSSVSVSVSKPTCETPKSPPGDYNSMNSTAASIAPYVV